MNDNQPLWYLAMLTIGGGIMKLLSMLDIGGIFKARTKVNKDCAKEVARLKFVVVKMDTTLKLIAQFLNNPENVETTKESIEIHLKEIAPIIDEINKENSINQNE